MTTPDNAEAQSADRTIPLIPEMGELIVAPCVVRISRSWWVNPSHIVAIREDGAGFGTVFTTDGREFDVEGVDDLIEILNGENE